MAEYVTEKPKTVCIECQHFFNTSGSDCPGYVCEAPAVQPPRVQWDRVVGRLPDYCARLTIYCHDINDGNCPHFEPKGTP